MTLEGIEHGDDMARKAAAEHIPPLPLTDPRVQVFLAKTAFPNDSNAMDKWIDGEEDQNSLSRRFRAYIEDPSSTISAVDVTDGESLEGLLALVRAHEPERDPETRH